MKVHLHPAEGLESVCVRFFPVPTQIRRVADQRWLSGWTRHSQNVGTPRPALCVRLAFKAKCGPTDIYGSRVQRLDI